MFGQQRDFHHLWKSHTCSFSHMKPLWTTVQCSYKEIDILSSCQVVDTLRRLHRAEQYICSQAPERLNARLTPPVKRHFRKYRSRSRQGRLKGQREHQSEFITNSPEYDRVAGSRERDFFFYNTSLQWLVLSHDLIHSAERKTQMIYSEMPLFSLKETPAVVMRVFMKSE